MSENKKYKIKKGSLLVAEPFMIDPNFRRGVVFICDYQADGSFGFLLNKSIEMNITELVSSFPEIRSEVYYGGPVQTDTIHYLHTKGDLLDNSTKVLEGLYWGGDFDQLKSAIDLGQIQSEDIRFFVGYSGWDAQQLEAEQKNYSWMVVDGALDYVLGADNKRLWHDVLAEQEGVYSVISQMEMPYFN